ncbi:MAG TPA: HEAT repeat domain-containing protein, partial [Chloroflexia bacterium]|nr:HEAT repeat domain-containing protein [Chloroflexia bacterium]
AVELLLGALHDAAPLVQWKAAHALRSLHTRALVPPERLVFHEGAVFDRWKAGVLAHLAQDLADPDPAVRLEAAASLGEIADATTLPALLGAAFDSVPPVRWEVRSAILTLAARDPHLREASRRYLSPLLHEGDPLVRSTGADLLGRLGDWAAMPALLPLLHDADEAVRRVACLALGRLGDHGAVEALVGRLADDAPGVREAAAAALGHIGDPYAVTPLVHVRGDEAPVVRQAVAAALLRIDRTVGMPVLLGALGDSDPGTRLAAVDLLGAVGDAQAVKALGRLARDRAVVGTRQVGPEAKAARTAIRKRLRAPAGAEGGPQA